MKTPSRLYFEKLLNENKKYIKGLVLNIGGGRKLYKNLCQKMINIDLYQPADIKANFNFQLPFKKESFDTVIFTYALQFAVNPKFTISQIWEVLKQKGYLILAVSFLEKYLPDPKSDFWRFSQDAVKLLLKNKFEIIELEPVGGRFILLLNFLYYHRQIPRFLIKLLYPLAKKLTRKEKKKEEWTNSFFVIARKIV